MTFNFPLFYGVPFVSKLFIWEWVVITTGRAMASIILAPTRSTEKSTRVLFCTNSVFVKDRLGFCQKSTLFLSKIDSVFVKNRLGFSLAPTRSAEKSTRFLP